MSTTTQSLRQHLMDMIQQLDEGHLTAAQAFLRVLALSKPAPLPQARSFVPMPPDTEATPEEDAEFMRTLMELHDDHRP